MKRILFLLLLIPFIVNAQVDTTRPLNPVNTIGNEWKNGQFDSSLRLPLDTFKFKHTWRGIAFKNDFPYFYDGIKWQPFTGSVTPTLQTVFDQENARSIMNKNDTIDISTHRLTFWKNSNQYVNINLTDNNGGVTIIQKTLSEVPLYAEGFDYGWVKMWIHNSFDSSITPHNYASAASGLFITNRTGGFGQLYVGAPRNSFINDGFIMGASGIGGLRMFASGSGAPIMFAQNSNGSNEYARFTQTGRFGIKTTTPDSTFHVIGGLKFVTGRQAAGYVLTSDASGGADWQPSSGASGLQTNITTNPNLTVDNNIDGGNHELAFTNNNTMQIQGSNQMNIASGLSGGRFANIIMDSSINLQSDQGLITAKLNSGAGTKSVRYDPSTNLLTYGDTSATIVGSGITSLNGLTGSIQTFATPGTSGTAPSWSSSITTHTLNIPLASASSVTAGLLSKTDYDAFNAKLSTDFFSADKTQTADRSHSTGGFNLTYNNTLNGFWAFNNTAWETFITDGSFTTSTDISQSKDNFVAQTSNSGTTRYTFFRTQMLASAMSAVTPGGSSLINMDSAMIDVTTATFRLQQTSLKIKGASSNTLTIKPNETLSAGRTLSIVTGDANRSLTFAGDATISGTNSGDQTITLTSDVTGSGTGSFATTIANNAVTNAKAAQMAAHTFKGNNTGSTANSIDLTATQLTAEINQFSSSLQGVVPSSGGGTSNFLRADGTWATPAGSGDMVLASAQTVTGAKTFNDTKLLMRNVANTFNGSFTNTNTADRVYTLPDVAGTVALTTSNISGSAATLTTSRNIWGQSFNGSADVTGSLTSVGDITGGASSMNIIAGTGNSRTITLKSTTSGGTATAFLTGNSDQSSTFGGNISGTGAWNIIGGAGNMTIISGTGNSRTMILQTTTSGGTATTALTLAADQSATFANTVNATTFVGALTGNSSTATSAATLTTARNIQGVSFNGSAAIDIINGTGFVKATGTTLSYDNSTYLTTASAASTYQPLDADLTTIAGLTATTDNFMVGASSTWASRTPTQVKTSLALNNVENTALSTWAGTSNITTLGTVTTGTINTRWKARVGNTTSSATPTINTDNVDIYKLTAQAVDITSMTTNLSGTPNDGDVLKIEITGTATRNITWGASFVNSSNTAPTSVTSTTTTTFIWSYSSTSSYGNNKWIFVKSY